jgi:hypothetical protein
VLVHVLVRMGEFAVPVFMAMTVQMRVRVMMTMLVSFAHPVPPCGNRPRPLVCHQSETA